MHLSYMKNFDEMLFYQNKAESKEKFMISCYYLIYIHEILASFYFSQKHLRVIERPLCYYTWKSCHITLYCWQFCGELVEENLWNTDSYQISFHTDLCEMFNFSCWRNIVQMFYTWIGKYLYSQKHNQSHEVRATSMKNVLACYTSWIKRSELFHLEQSIGWLIKN